jgi:four helix bundle protein
MNFRNLNTWELGMKLTKTIYEITEKFPDSERFALANQLQRAAVSIPSNIAEGSARGHTKEYIQFLFQARGSIAEVITQLELAKMLGYVEESVVNDIFIQIDDLYKMINATIKTLKEKYIDH